MYHVVHFDVGQLCRFMFAGAMPTWQVDTRSFGDRIWFLVKSHEDVTWICHAWAGAPVVWVPSTWTDEIMMLWYHIEYYGRRFHFHTALHSVEIRMGTTSWRHWLQFSVTYATVYEDLHVRNNIGRRVKIHWSVTAAQISQDCQCYLSSCTYGRTWCIVHVKAELGLVHPNF